MDPVTITLLAVAAAGAIAGTGMQMKGASSQSGYYEQSAEMMQKQQGYLRQEAQFQERQFEMQAEASLANARSFQAEGKMSVLAGEYNQVQAKREEVMIKRRAGVKAALIAETGGKIMGAQVVGYLSSGLELEGTPALMLAETDHKVKEDVANVLEAGDYAALDAAERGAMANIAGMAGASRASAGRIDSLSRALSASSAGRFAGGPGLSSRLFANQTEIYGMRSQAQLARIGMWGSLFSGVGRAAGVMAGGFA